MSGDHNQYQNPASQCERCGEKNPAEIHTCTPKQEQPVAWVAYENGEKHGIDFDEDEIAELLVGTMLYTAPPKKEWQGLTDEEIDDLMPYVHSTFDGEENHDFARAIEAKLKEKNT